MFMIEVKLVDEATTGQNVHNLSGGRKPLTCIIGAFPWQEQMKLFPKIPRL